jgi:hypothetical protein
MDPQAIAVVPRELREYRHHPADIGQSRKYASEKLWSCFILANLASNNEEARIA